MTEVPEHLLQRSRERRAALGLGGGDAAPAAPSADQGASAPASAAAAAEVTPAPAPAAPAEPAAPPPPPPPPPPYVTAAMTRPKVPVWALPVLAMLPIWAIVYAGALAVPEEGITDPVLAEGEQVYAASCAGCHGASGGGGTGRPLSGGEVLLTFPDPQQHIAWVQEGSPAAGTPYGDPDRPGGQHIAGEMGLMPGFADSLSEEEILAVTRYEREILGGETESVLAGGEGASPAGEAEAEGGDIGEAGEGEGGAEPGSGESAGGA